MKEHPKRKQLSRWFEGGVEENLNEHTKDSHEADEWKPWVSKELQKNLKKETMIEWDVQLFGTPFPEVVLPLMFGC